ncbi:transcriptional attenuator, LytR family [Synechococcus sp. PCC 7502]|uniref:LCP family protein n=1 Tax=Synechococcus sp. PCC 7502 TaxID=1173263 RepID=UPI00029F95B3|nr:LCP family protein [Synechococcus sp. PCC 7502]AFY73342.1 transcriptional attenuator, LytR family [Synechococcus sp. PCC 7502]
MDDNNDKISRLSKLRSRPLIFRVISLGKIFIGLTTLTAVGLGIGLAQIVPLQNFDWGGLVSGRNPQEVFAEGLGHKLTQPYQVLIMGIDGADGFNSRSDTMLLVRFDNSDRRTNILSIPRDTRVRIPNYGYAKINAANVYGGAKLAISTVQQKLNGVKIDRYIRVDSSGLDEVIDAIGGVDIDVPKSMKYEDKTQKLTIDLQPGLQTLNGKQAEGFIRFRHDELGDIGRIKRQQMLLQALKAKMANPLTLIRLPELISVIQKHTDTNLSNDEIMAIALFSISLKSEQIHTESLGGIPSEPYQFDALYWLVDENDINQAISGKFVSN